MGIEEVYNVIHRISEGFADECTAILHRHSGVLVHAVTEQIYCGVDGNDKYLSPNYDDDPFFEEEGEWYHRSEDYKAWKRHVTPPIPGPMLGLDPRPDNVPNLFITGKFHSEINAVKAADGLLIDPGSDDGPDIVRKWGDQILRLGTMAVRFFNNYYMLPDIDSYFKRCGYR